MFFRCVGRVGTLRVRVRSSGKAWALGTMMLTLRVQVPKNHILTQNLPYNP